MRSKKTLSWCAGPSSPEPKPAPPSSSAAGPRHRSLGSLTSGLNPGRGTLHKLWTGSKSSVTNDQRQFKDWNQSDLSSVIRQAGFQMGALGNLAHPMSPHWSSSCRARGSWSEQWVEQADTDMLVLPPSRAPPAPSPPAPHLSCPRQSPPPVPVPNRPPPPPPPPLATDPSPPSPLPELSPANESWEPDEDESLRRLVTPLRRRRRAKTPVRSIGQLERTFNPTADSPGVNRMSSVCTIARQYRALVVDDEHLSAGDSEPHPPKTPEPDLESLCRPSDQASPSSPTCSLHRFRRCSRLAPSLVSDDGTLVAFEDELLPLAKAYRRDSFSALDVGPRAQMKAGLRSPPHDNITDSRFQNGLGLLTRELSSALASQADGENQHAMGLQVWVIIEAYERLRTQIVAADPVNEDARATIDSWLDALHATHRTLAGEAATGDSEYED